MKTIIGAVCASIALMALAPAQAWANPQHERMRRCNAEAKEQTLKGEERKAFMSTCLRGRHEAGAAPAGAAATAPAAAPAAAGVDGPGEVVKAPVAAAAAVAPAAMAVPAAAMAVPAAAMAVPAAATTAAPTTVAAAETASAEDKARAKACNRSASEQSLRGAKRKAFVAECLKG